MGRCRVSKGNGYDYLYVWKLDRFLISVSEYKYNKFNLTHSSTLEGLTVRDDVLVEIATFLSRRWSDKPKALVTFTEEANPKTSPIKTRLYYLTIVGMLEIDFKSIASGVCLCGTSL
jgi:hypothetical protein